MKPFIIIPMLGEVHINSMAILLSFIFSLLTLYFMTKDLIKLRELKIYQLLCIGAVTSLSAFLGARIFHVLIERPSYFWENPNLILTQFDGMTLYGSLMAGGLTLFFMTRFFSLSEEASYRIWDGSVFSTCITLTLMRLGCFANGCCWGKISTFPWAVQYYDPRSVMPYKGIPVHPVQIYDSILAATIGFVLWIIWKEKWGRGQLVLYFCLFYPVTRFFTEYLRADSYRGEDIIIGLSVSQLISILLFVFSVLYLRKSRKSRKSRTELGKL